MNRPLLIVESPTKVRTLKKSLGSEYEVVATVGHIIDLPAKELGVDIEDGFKPKYAVIPSKQKVIKDLKKAAKGVTDIYLAPDPDREGEAIAWHTASVLKSKDRRFFRILFHELTPKAILNALSSPQQLDKNKFDAQQARRILDRLVGYQVSPLLWQKVRRGLSAGRVQSVAVRIICDREKEIFAFEPEEYWSVTANLKGEAGEPFTAKLVKKKNKKIKISSQDEVENILGELNHPFSVKKIIKKTIRRNPLPPFTTSKLQQDSIKRLRFSAKKTMTVAQQLYEGIDLGPGEPVGLITYMRTDSTRISAEAAKSALHLIKEKFGPDYAMDRPRAFKNRNKAQDAHEAIRPTDVEKTPESIARHLTEDQLKLYSLIWQRFVASQMKPAVIDQVTASIACSDYLFSASGSTIVHPGFMAMYQSEEKPGSKKERLPKLSENQVLTLISLIPKRHETIPPPRFTEASLVKELEENGIGRPSTYATILSTIREKKYVEMVKGFFRPTELGFLVNDLLTANFPELFNVEFTAKMEENLDRIETAQTDLATVLEDFYERFESALKKALQKMTSLKRVGAATGLLCPSCGKELSIKIGKNGPFLACNGYPDCRYASDYTRDQKGRIIPVTLSKEESSDVECEKCGRPMEIKNGRFGKFLACTGYPECKATKSLLNGNSGSSTGVKCPETGCQGELVEKKSRRGKVFYGCNRYPDCSFALWDKPVDKRCPSCNHSYLVEKTTKKNGTLLICPKKECGFKQKP